MSRHIEVTFCDDIREEVGGKLSFMGIYSGDMIVPGFPVVLPKLCININVVSPIDEPVVELLQVSLYQDGLDSPILTDGPFPVVTLPDKDGGGIWHLVQMTLVLAPFQIDNATTLRVIVETESGKLRGRSLGIVCSNR